MDTGQLKDWVEDIQVRNVDNSDVEVENNSPLIMIGKGRQGAVFKITDDICVKVFGNTEDCDREHYALFLGQDTNLFPKIHAKGSLYIAMDMVKGVDVREYLQSQPLTRELSWKLIEMLITFKKIGFERIDHHKRQIYIQEDGNLKVIDVARTVWRDRVYPYPRKLLNSLGEANKALFLTHVQEMSPDLYEEWIHYIRLEEISHQIYQILLPERSDKVKLKHLSQKLLTREDEEQYVVQLHGLVHKVFKEEWIKTMLARGKDPNEVMKKIDKYWESLEKRERRDTSKNDKKLSKEVKRYEGDSKRIKERYKESGKRYEGVKSNDRFRSSSNFKKFY